MQRRLHRGSRLRQTDSCDDEAGLRVFGLHVVRAFPWVKARNVRIWGRGYLPGGDARQEHTAKRTRPRGGRRGVHTQALGEPEVRLKKDKSDG